MNRTVQSYANSEPAGPAFSLPLEYSPDFVALFPVCYCRSCTVCSRWQLTPFNAGQIWCELEYFKDEATADIERNHDTPIPNDWDLREIDGEPQWSALGWLPEITWRQNCHWRKQMTDAFQVLAHDLTTGRQPRPRCLAEQVALHTAISSIDDCGDRDEFAPGAPEHHDDYDFDKCLTQLIGDIEYQALFSDQDVYGPLMPPPTFLTPVRPTAWFCPAGCLSRY